MIINTSVYLIFLAILFGQPTQSKTDPRDVLALGKLFKQLNRPNQLRNWAPSKGADPCGDNTWTGVICEGDTVTNLILVSLNLSGSLETLDMFWNLAYLDLSQNNFVGEIPNKLPLNINFMDLSGNEFRGHIPLFAQFQNLLTLNLSHNSLNGPIGEDVFAGSNIGILDLSYNLLSGELPQSIGSLQNIQILNLEWNCFEGEFPKSLKNIPHIWIQKQCASPPPFEAPPPPPPPSEIPPPPSVPETLSPPSETSLPTSVSTTFHLPPLAIFGIVVCGIIGAALAFCGVRVLYFGYGFGSECCDCVSSSESETGPNIEMVELGESQRYLREEEEEA